MATPLIEIDRVGKSFDGGKSFAVRDVTIAVEPESTVERVVSQEAVVPGKGPLFDVAQLSPEALA